MNLDPTILLLLLGLATTFVIAVSKAALGGGLAMLATPLLWLPLEPAPSLVA